MKYGMLVSILSFLMVATSMAQEKSFPLFDFREADAAKEWQTVNDGVMGGVSDGRFRITDTKTMEFFGTISLANNGGFASVRTKPKKLDLEKGDILVARVRGDGCEYTFNLYPTGSPVAYSYRAALQTKRDQWIEVKIPLDRFEATSFGRVLKSAGAVKPGEIATGAILLFLHFVSAGIDTKWLGPTASRSGN